MIAARLSGCVRLDDRRSLARRLGLDGSLEQGTTDLELAGAAYERWGERCVDKLEGDFAFTVTDARTGRSFAARDPLGVRPLYYRLSEHGLMTASSASEVALSGESPAELDESRVADALVPELEPGDRVRTFYRDTFRLPPGHLLVFENGHLATRAYWRPDPGNELRLASDGAYVEAFRERFEAAVRSRLSPATGSMLSGGLDSSAICGFAGAIRRREGGPPLVTLSAVDRRAGCEETRCIRSILARGGFDAERIGPHEVGSFGATLETFVDTMEEPFDASMVLPLLMYAAARQRGCRSVMDGVDGDVAVSVEPAFLEEMIAAGAWGAAWREASALARFYRGTYAPWGSASRLLASSALRHLAPSSLRSLSRRLRRPGRIAVSLSDSIVSADLARQAGVGERLESLWALRAPTGRSSRERHAIEIEHPNVAAALERYQRVAASQGIEARHPFFDRRLVEMGLALPRDQKVRDGWSKYILRRACEGILPDDVRWRRGRWVRLGPAFLAAAVRASSRLVEREVASGMAELTPYVDRRKLLGKIEGWRQEADAAGTEEVWRLAALNAWLRNVRRNMYDARPHAHGPRATSRLPVPGSRVPVLQEI